MAFVTDPDDLDRWNVCVNPQGETISIRGLGTARTTANGDDGTSAGTTTFKSGTANFSTDCAQGDIVTIISGAGAGHYTISSVDSSDQLTLNAAVSGSASNLTYKTNEPKATGGAAANVADGVTMQALYSFLKEEWRTLAGGLGNAPDLIQFVFPIESITREQFEIGGTTHSDWDFADNTTRELLRTGGWAQIDSGGTTQAEYAGIITLGSLDSDAQVYYQQVDAAQAPTDFVLTGPVNQAILTYDGTTDNRTYLKLFCRKKARTYAGSEIADIGVTTIETIVNRFPLAHATDAAITASDGELAGSSVWGTVTEVNDSVSGAGEGISDPSAGDGLFTFTHNGALFTTTNEVSVGDVIYFDNTAQNLYGNTYEIQAVTDGSTLVLYEEPGAAAISDETAVNYITRTRYIVHPGDTDGVTADATADDGIGEFTSATVGNFASAGVAAGDYLRLTDNGDGTGVQGVYKISSVDTSTLNVNISDNENWDAATGVDFEVLEPGMFLQKKSNDSTMQGSPTLTWGDDDPDTIVRSAGSWTTDGFTDGCAITVTNANTSANNGTYIVDAVTDATTLTLIASEAVTADAADSSANIVANEGFVRTLNQVEYPFNWRLFGNNGTLAQAFQFIQKELRRTGDIDEATGTSRGDVTDLLMSFASPTGTGLNLFIDDLNSSDTNNATFNDVTDDARNFAFIAGVTINLNDNITSSSSTRIVIFFTNDDAGDNNGYDFGTPNAIIVQDADGTNQVKADQGSSFSFNYDYDNNVQRGAASAGDPAPITVVAIGTDTAQYVRTDGTIQRQNTNTIAMVAALERNYDNP